MEPRTKKCTTCHAKNIVIQFGEKSLGKQEPFKASWRPAGSYLEPEVWFDTIVN